MYPWISALHEDSGEFGSLFSAKSILRLLTKLRYFMHLLVIFEATGDVIVPYYAIFVVCPTRGYPEMIHAIGLCHRAEFAELLGLFRGDSEYVRWDNVHFLRCFVVYFIEGIYPHNTSL
jgi:hypothetical protein